MTTAHDSPDSAEIPPPQDDLATRKMLGPYELKKKLGQGGMGAVYLAVDTNLRRQVALKILPREKASNPQLVKRFKAEAQNASQLTHDNIVAVYGAGEADGYLFIALEFIDGIDVYDLVERRGVLPVKRSIDIIKQVARALQHALDQGIVHRDIKPANLLIRRDGTVKLADMGLARAVDESMETGITRAGTTVGTVDYMSPEQARNSKAADVRSDIYSLGCTWYHMLTGQPPFAEGSLTNKLHAHAKQPPPDPRDKNENVHEGVVAVLQRMMAKDPDDRYQTPAELLKDLEGALINKDVVSRRILEAIEDESFKVKLDESDHTDTHPPPLDSEYDSDVPAEMDWTDSVADAQSPRSDSSPQAPTGRSARRHVERYEPEEVEPDDGGTYQRSAPKKEKERARPRRELGHAEVDEPDADVDTGDRSSGRKSKPAKESAPGNYRDTRQAPAGPAKDTSGKSWFNWGKSTPKPEAAPTRSSGRGGAKTTGSPAAGTPRTLPPPKRKLSDVPDDPSANKLSPGKVLFGIVGVLVGIGLLIYLADVAQHLGDSVAPAPVNQVGGDVPAQPQPAPPQAAPGVEAADAAKPKNDVLTERQDQLASAGNTNSQANVSGIKVAPPVGPPRDVPEWVDQSLGVNQVPMFNVRKGPTIEAERQYASLQEAFKSARSTGARIVLFHDGPFDLLPTELGPGVITLEAAQGARPQIRLVSEGEHHKLPWLNMTGGSLLLDGVNIVGDAGVVPLADPWTWIRVTDGNLYVRRSTLTLTGNRSGPTTALRLDGVVADPATREVSAPRFLMDESVLRGDGLSGVHLESPAFDAVLRKTLILAGDATAITIRSTDKPIANAIRKLRSVRTTIGSRHQALLLSSQKVPVPLETEISVHETLFAAPGHSTNPVLLFLEDWPATRPRAADAPPYRNLHWNATSSAILGFHPLLKVSTDDAATVTDGTGWKKLFRETVPTTFSPLNWPAEIPGGVASAPLKTWSLKSLDALALSFPVAGVTPGCPVSNLRAAEGAEGNKPSSQPQRPRPPAPFAVKSTQQVDLNKTDLGKFLASKNWDDDTLFVASGSSVRQSSPILVEKHRWRIQFKQTDGPTLVITPKSAGRSGGDNGAFITVKEGQLDLQFGSFTFDAKDSHSITPWFLSVDNGGFSLLNCRVVSPLSAASKNHGLIHWTMSEGPQKPAADNEFASYGQITDSLLVGNGTLISADLAGRAFLLNNSALISRQHGIELKVGLESGQAPSAVDAQNCTYLIGGTFFSINSRTPSGMNPLPARIAHYDSIFASLNDSTGRTAPLLMNYVGAGEIKSQVLWYEESCGYSPEIKAFYTSLPKLPTSAVSVQEFDTEWLQRWGSDRVQRPLRGADGVLFEKPLPATFSQVRPENLNLHKTAKARTWSEAGGPIGVRTPALEPPAAPPKTPGSKRSHSNPSVQFGF